MGGGGGWPALPGWTLFGSATLCPAGLVSSRQARLGLLSSAAPGRNTDSQLRWDRLGWPGSTGLVWN